MPKVFISHRWAEGEHEFASELKKRLENYKDITVLLDEYEMLPGDTIQDWRGCKINRGHSFVIKYLSSSAPKTGSGTGCKKDMDT